jgi:hypothetical protein
MDTAIRPAFENDAKEIAWEEAHRPLGVIEQNQDEDIVRLTAAARVPAGGTRPGADRSAAHEAFEP